jgi:hypothetical protein
MDQKVILEAHDTLYDLNVTLSGADHETSDSEED